MPFTYDFMCTQKLLLNKEEIVKVSTLNKALRYIAKKSPSVST